MSHGAALLFLWIYSCCPLGAAHDPVDVFLGLVTRRRRPRIIRYSHEHPGPARDGRAQRCCRRICEHSHPSIYDEAQRASSGGPTILNIHASLSKKCMNGRLRPPAAACGGGCGRRSPRCLLAAACGRLTHRGGGLRRRPAAPPCGGGLRPLCGGGLRRCFHRDSLKTFTRIRPCCSPAVARATHHACFLSPASVFFSCARLRRRSSRTLPLRAATPTSSAHGRFRFRVEECVKTFRRSRSSPAAALRPPAAAAKADASTS